MLVLKNLDDNKIFSYLGYKKDKHILTEDVLELVASCKEEILKTARPKFLFSPTFDLRTYENQLFADNLLLVGKNIKAHLNGCDRAVFLAVTIGIEIDRLIRTAEATNMARAVVLDAVSNVAVEEAADIAENQLRERLASKKEYLTGRFSPGYGDFPISFGRELLRYVDAARRIGLSVTQSGIMTPRKSVSAVLGISKTKVCGKLATCENCVLREKCDLRKEGKSCGEAF